MRTTLKRGLGRGAAPNGNGRAVFPPGSSSPVTFYRQPGHSGRSRAALVGKIAMWLGIACLVVATGTAGGAYLYFHESVAAVAAKTPAVRKAARQLDVPLPDQPAVALVIGYDARKGEGPSGRSDTLMLVRADPTTDSISLLSFPRDMRVEIRCPGRTPYFDKINAAYASCGPQGSLQTVRTLTGVQIHYLITVNFRGFRQIVDRQGGAWIDVDRRYFNDRERTERVRDDQSPAGVPAAHRAADARLRPVSPYGLRPLSRRAPAAVREGVQGADPGGLRADVAPQGRERGHEQRRGRPGRRGGCRWPDRPLVRALRLRPSAWPRVPDAHRGTRGLRGSHDRLGEHHEGRVDLHAPRRRVLREGNGGRARREGEDRSAASAGDDDHGAQRKRCRWIGLDGELPPRAALVPGGDASERPSGQCAELRLLPHEGLLRQITPAVARGCAEGREPVRVRRARAVASRRRPALERRDADRHRRADVPRQSRLGPDRPDAEARACERRVRPERRA